MVEIAKGDINSFTMEKDVKIILTMISYFGDQYKQSTKTSYIANY
mgnify:CR=1 FL=1